MDYFSSQPEPLGDRMTLFWKRAVRMAARLAIALGLSVVTAILLGAAVTDNGFVQLIVTVFAALGLWIPFAVLVTMLDRLLVPRSRRTGTAAAESTGGGPVHHGWRRLSAIAPAQAQRVAVLQRSLDRSRLALGKADLDPDAHDLCVLIDRRLPELIDRELDTLPPDDRNRGRQIDELVDLIEQFARHCSRKQAGEVSDAGFEAAVLRRRFEDRLSDHRGLAAIERAPDPR